MTTQSTDTPPRGQVTLVVGQNQYRLQYDWNAVADFEQELGEPYLPLFQRMFDGQFGARELRAFLWAGLREHHPDITLRQAGTMLDAAGFGEVLNIVLPVLSSVFSTRERSSGNGRAAAGAGTRS